MKSICPNTFQTMINETIQLVDVRERYEFELYKMNLPIVENIPFSEIEELWSNFDADKKIIFVGDGATKAKEILQLSQAEFNDKIYPSAKYLMKKAVEKFNKNEFEDVAYFEPFYLKDFHGVKKKKSGE